MSTPKIVVVMQRHVATLAKSDTNSKKEQTNRQVDDTSLVALPPCESTRRYQVSVNFEDVLQAMATQHVAPQLIVLNQIQETNLHYNINSDKN